jgi:hypothetical protein
VEWRARPSRRVVPRPDGLVFKFLVIFIIGISIGYSYGFKDAKKNKRNVLERVVDRVGGKNRGAYDTNLDKQAESVGH